MYQFSIAVYKLPQTQQFKITHIYYITVSVSQETRHSLYWSSAKGLIKLQSKHQSGYVLTGGLTKEEFASKVTQVVDRILLVVGLRALAFRWLETVLSNQRPPAVPCYVGFPKMAAYFIKPARSVSKLSRVSQRARQSDILSFLPCSMVQMQVTRFANTREEIAHKLVSIRRWASQGLSTTCSN